MVLTKIDLEESLDVLRVQLKTVIDDSIRDLREQVINNLVAANHSLQGKVEKLEKQVHSLTLEVQSSLQYNRLNNLVISGIPEDVEHEDLEKAAIGIINTCLTKPVDDRDFEACHRISQRSSDVVCRLVNRKNVEEALGNWKKLKKLNKAKVGLPLNTGEIFINTHLTPFKSTLAFHCRELKRKGKIKNISTKKGNIKILVCDLEDKETLVWKSINHLDDLKDFDN